MVGQRISRLGPIQGDHSNAIPDGAQQFEPVSRFDSTLNRVVALPIDAGPDGEQVFLTLFGTGLRHLHAAASAKVAGLPSQVQVEPWDAASARGWGGRGDA